MASEDWDLRSSSGGRGGRLSALSWYPRRARNAHTKEGGGRVKHVDWLTRMETDGQISHFRGEKEVNVRADGAAARLMDISS
jgi:hypothetical protein